MDEPQEIWAWCLANWHKILVLVLAAASAWKYFFEYIRPVTHKEEMSIKIPKEGVKITIEPLDKDHSSEEES